MWVWTRQPKTSKSRNSVSGMQRKSSNKWSRANSHTNSSGLTCYWLKVPKITQRTGHQIVVSTMGCSQNTVYRYDSLHKNIDATTRATLAHLLGIPEAPLQERTCKPPCSKVARAHGLVTNKLLHCMPNLLFLCSSHHHLEGQVCPLGFLLYWSIPLGHRMPTGKESWASMRKIDRMLSSSREVAVIEPPLSRREQRRNIYREWCPTVCSPTTTLMA